MKHLLDSTKRMTTKIGVKFNRFLFLNNKKYSSVNVIRRRII